MSLQELLNSQISVGGIVQFIQSNLMAIVCIYVACSTIAGYRLLRKSNREYMDTHASSDSDAIDPAELIFSSYIGIALSAIWYPFYLTRGLFIGFEKVVDVSGKRIKQ